VWKKKQGVGFDLHNYLFKYFFPSFKRGDLKHSLQITKKPNMKNPQLWVKMWKVSFKFFSTG
jgi:hypothetical protein